MSITLSDREEATCRLALRLLLSCRKDHDRLREQYPDLLSREEVEELVDTMGPNAGKAFNEGMEDDPDPFAGRSAL